MLLPSPVDRRDESGTMDAVFQPCDDPLNLSR